MSMYVLDVPRFDATQPGNVRLDRFVVFGEVDGELASARLVMDEAGEENLGRWAIAERLGLYEEMRKAERNWRALVEVLGRPDNAPGRVA